MHTSTRTKRLSRAELKASHPNSAEPSSASVSEDRRALELRALQSLRTIFGSARTHDAQLRRSAGISGSQLWALSEIARWPDKDGLTVNGLSARMALHQTTASNLVNVLAERGLIQRERDNIDQRVVHLRTTAEGEKLLLRTPDPHAGLLVDALQRLESERLEQVGDCLEWVLRQMSHKAGAAAGQTLLGE